MSCDGEYLLAYESQPYARPTPMQRDAGFLSDNYDVTVVSEFLLHASRLKYRMKKGEREWLAADQVFEKTDCDGRWRELTRNVTEEDA